MHGLCFWFWWVFFLLISEGEKMIFADHFRDTLVRKVYKVTYFNWCQYHMCSLDFVWNYKTIFFRFIVFAFNCGQE